MSVYVEQIRAEVRASQVDGFSPINAWFALEKVKADIAAIPSTDITNPERKEDAAYIIEGMQIAIAERTGLAEAVGWVSAPITARKLAVEASQKAVEAGGEIVRPAYQKLKELIGGRGPDAPNGTSSRNVDADRTINRDAINVTGESDFYHRVDNAGKTIPDTPLRHEAYKQDLIQQISTEVRWGNASTLDSHVVRHGQDFGVSDPALYGQMANDFLSTSGNSGVQRIVSKDGVIRVYDPRTNTFGSYNADGTTKTFYKPRQGQEYWEDQKRIYGN